MNKFILVAISLLAYGQRQMSVPDLVIFIKSSVQLKNDDRAVADTVRRIGYVSGIWKALQILYSDQAMADGWLKRPNRYFGGQTLDEIAVILGVDVRTIKRDWEDARAWLRQFLRSQSAPEPLQ